MPPIEKVYEAWSAIADERVELKTDAGEACVTSSDGSKHYTICWQDTHYTSNDRATYWAGYPGYPVLAVWMKQGILPLNEEMAGQFRGIDWNELNRQYRRNYAKAAAFVMEQNHLDAEKARQEAQRVMDVLKDLNLTTGRGKGKP